MGENSAACQILGTIDTIRTDDVVKGYDFFVKGKQQGVCYEDPGTCPFNSGHPTGASHSAQLVVATASLWIFVACILLTLLYLWRRYRRRKAEIKDKAWHVLFGKFTIQFF